MDQRETIYGKKIKIKEIYKITEQLISPRESLLGVFVDHLDYSDGINSSTSSSVIEYLLVTNQKNWFIPR